VYLNEIGKKWIHCVMLNLYNLIIFEDDMALFRKKMVWVLVQSWTNVTMSKAQNLHLGKIDHTRYYSNITMFSFLGLLSLQISMWVVSFFWCTTEGKPTPIKLKGPGIFCSKCNTTNCDDFTWCRKLEWRVCKASILNLQMSFFDRQNERSFYIWT
jgi:hypothetical protein